MPKCNYCGQIPFRTCCPSFFAHVDECRKRENRAILEKINQERQKQQELRKELETQREISAKLDRVISGLCTKKEKNIQNNVYNIQTVVCGDQINIMNLYADYPKTPFFVKAIGLVEECDVDTLTDLEKDVILPLQANDPNNELYDMMDYSAPTLKTSQAYSFIADVVRRLREKMEKRPCPNTKMIEEAKSVEKDCLEIKASLKV